MNKKILYVQALYDFSPIDSNELSFKRGDIFKVISKIDENWLNTVLLTGDTSKKGIIPLNYVKEIDLPSKIDGEALFAGKADFPIIENGDLNFSIGEILIGITRIDENWYYGCYLFDTNKKGIFPVTHVNLVNVEVSTLKSNKARACQKFENSGSDYLRLDINDLISIIEEVDDCWFYGQLSSGEKGLFPRVCVERIYESGSCDKIQKNNCLITSDESIDTLKLFKSKSFETLPKNFIEKRKFSFEESLNDQKMQQEISSSTLKNRKTIFNPEYYRAIQNHTPNDPNNLSCLVGEILETFSLETSHTNSITVRNLNGQTGLVPLSVLERLTAQDEAKAKETFLQRYSQQKYQFNEILNEKLKIRPQTLSSKTVEIFVEKENEKNFNNEIDYLLFSTGELKRDSIASKPEIKVPPPLPEKPKDLALKKLHRTSNQNGSSNNICQDSNKDDKKLQNRKHIIQEIIDTEKAYYAELSALNETLKCNDLNKPLNLNTELLFGNLSDVLQASLCLIKLFDSEMEKDDDLIRMGHCLNNSAIYLQKSYATYCKNYPNIYATIKKYEGDLDIQNYIQTKTEKIKSYGFLSLPMSLIKPVQRITKYSLFIDQLIKSTDESHCDYETLIEASKTYSELLVYINEYKRRQEVISKYFHKDDKRPVSIAIPTIKKKSDRIRVKLSTILGLHDPLIDIQFNLEEENFRITEKNLRSLLLDSKFLIGSLKELVECNISIFSESSNLFQDEIEIYTKSDEIIVKILEFRDFYGQLETQINDKIWIPIQTCLNLYEMPNMLIRKRIDKLTDYEAELERYNGIDRTTALKTGHPLETKKNIYEAINGQLKDDLPKLTAYSAKILNLCITRFLKILRNFYEQFKLKLFNNEFDANINRSSRDDLLISFERFFKQYDIRRSIGDLGSSSNLFTSYIETNDDNNTERQTDLLKQFLKQKYSSDKLFDVICPYEGNEKTCHLTVTKGDLVGLVKPYDLNGDKTIWLIDNGNQKGFVPSSILNPSNTKSPIEIMMSSNPESCICLYNFNSIHSTTMTIKEGEVLLVLEKEDKNGCKDWWLVQNSNGFKGYVPSNYVYLLE